MATSEIDKLERRYADNPQGLTFAPLAEVHRKNGDVSRALELLRIGLELHPNYIPASIVLGRCHQDQGDLAAAEAAFAHVLRLDDENVIALKSLADIMEKQERLGEAEQWLQRLVSVDRSNDEAHEQLRRVQEAKASGPAPVVPASSETSVVATDAPSAPEAEPAEAAPLELTEELSREPAAASAEPSQPASGVEDVSAAAAEEEKPHAEPVVAEPVVAESVSDQPSAPEAVQPLSGLMSQEFEAPKEPIESIESVDYETQDDVVLHSSVLSEFHVPDASEDLRSSPSGSEPDREREPPVPEPYRPESADPERTNVPGRADVPERAEIVEREPEPVVTETMAEVLLQQGYASDSLRIYRELARRAPHDDALQSRMAEAEKAAERLSAPKPSYSAREGNRRSVHDFFQAMLAARPRVDGAGTTSSSTAGVEAGPAGGPEEGLPVPPAIPGAPQRTEPGVSFDAFFSAPADRSASLQQIPPEPGSDDLDQFQSWLQNLKR
jgi:tetratricopeptide (TPR) repeat protein